MNTPLEENFVPIGNGHARRLPAQEPPPGPDLARHAEHTLTPRRRDSQGNRIAHSYVGSVPVTRHTQLAECHLRDTIDVIAQHRPGLAARLRSDFEDKLLHVGQVARDVREEQQLRHHDHNARVQANNEAIEAALDTLRQERDLASGPYRAELEALHDPLTAAHNRAGAAVAAAGGTYDPDHSDDTSCVLRDTPRPLEHYAEQLRLPFPHADDSILMDPRLSNALSVLLGLLIGVSFGIMAHAIQADSLGRQWPLAAAFWLVGCVIAFSGKYAVRYAWFVTARDYYLPTGALKWGAMFALASVFSLLLLLADLAVERQGLLAVQTLLHRAARLTGQSGASLGEEFALWLGPVVVTLGYLLCAAYEGAIKAQHKPVEIRLRALQDAEYREADAARRALPETRQALEAIAAVNELRRLQAALTARIAEVEAPFETRISEQEAGRLVPQPDLTEEARQLVQDAHDNYHLAQEVFDDALGRALADCEPPAHFWDRLRWLLDFRRPAPSDRHRRRGA